MTEIESKLIRVLRHSIDIGLLAILFVAPLIMGGRHPLGRLVFVGLVYATGIAWLTKVGVSRKKVLTFHWTFLIPLAGCGLVCFQLLPLEQNLPVFSPAIKSLLPVWSEGQNVLGTWQTISLAPVQTRISLAVLSAYVFLFFIIVNRIQSPAEIERWMKFLAGATIFLGLLGLVQYLLPNGRFLWIYAHPTRDTYGAATGPFTNPNHFSHLLALGIGPLMWMAFSPASCGSNTKRPSKPRRTGKSRTVHKPGTSKLQLVAIFGMSLVLIASLLSFSRGGTLLTFFAIAAGLILMVGRGNARHITPVLVAVTISVSALMIHGYHRVGSQLLTLTDDLSGAASDRMVLWRVLSDVILDFWRVGAGAGSHTEIYPAYLQVKPDVEYSHAENGYLQVLLETGAIGSVLLLSGILIVCRWLVQGFLAESRQRTQSIALGIGIAVSLIHALVDFVWYIPACMSFTIFLVALAFANRQPETNVASTMQVSFPRWTSALVMVAVAATCAIMVLWKPALASSDWDDYFTYSLAHIDKIESPSRSGRLSDAEILLEATPDAISEMRMHLQRVVRRDPKNARAHDRLASLYLQEFDRRQMETDNPMGVSQIRDAAYASGFKTKADLYHWLDLAIGDNLEFLELAFYHSLRAVEMCPLQGASYLYLSEIMFLRSPQRQLADHLLEQAQQVRPMDVSVLLAIGKRFADSGNVDMAFESWKQVFHLDRKSRDQIVQMMGSHLPAREFVDRFEPNLDDLKYLFDYYQNQSKASDVEAVTDAMVQELAETYASSDGATLEWVINAGERLFAVQRFSEAAFYFENAVSQLPFDFNVRWKLGVSAYRTSNYELAFAHLEWCDKKRPNTASIQRTLRFVQQRLIALAASQQIAHE